MPERVYPLLRPGLPVGTLRVPMGVWDPVSDPKTLDARVILRKKIVWKGSVPVITDDSEHAEVVLDLREVILGDRDVTGDLRVETTSDAAVRGEFEPPISNVVHEDGVVPELPANGGASVPTSGFGQTRPRSVPTGLSTVSIVPVPTQTPEQDDPRDEPPPTIFGEELCGPPAIPPFLGTCPPPALFEAAESTTSEASFSALDPVYVHNGEFVRSEQDYELATSRGPALHVVRTYRSRVRGQSMVGYGWTINLEKTLVDLTSTGGSGSVYKNGFGRSDRFDDAGAPETIGLYARIAPNASGGRDLLQGDGSRLSFDVGGRLARMSDRYDAALTYKYDSHGHLITVRDAIGRELTLTYGARGLLAAIQDWTGREIIYRHYDFGEAGGSQDDLKSITATAPSLPNYPDGPTTVYTYEYDATHASRVHNLVSVTLSDAVAALGIEPRRAFTSTDVQRLRDRATVLNRYDDTDRVVEQRYNAGTFFVSYSPNGRETAVTDRAKETATGQPQQAIFRYDGNVPLEIEHDSSLGRALFTFEHADAGHPESTAHVLPSGRRIELTYDRSNPDPARRGDLIALEWVGPNPGERVKSTQTLNGLGQVVRIVEPRGYAPGANGDRYAMELQHDAAGNIAQCVYPASSHYDAHGAVSGTSSRGVYKASYNAYGQAASTVDPAGVRNEFAYYLQGDAREGLLQSMRRISTDGSLVHETSFELDPLGRPIRVTQQTGAVTAAEYDVFNRVVATTDPLGARREYSYDALGRVTELRLQNLEPDGLGNYHLGTPEWFTESRKYDDYGRLLSVTRGSSDPAAPARTTTFGHDEADRLVSMVSNGGTETRYAYGPRSLPVQTMVAAGTADETAHTLKYDIDGQVHTVIDPDGHAVRHEYDWLGRLVALHDPIGAGAATSAVTRLEYDVSSHPTRVYRVDRNGVIVRDIRRTYDERGRIAMEEDALAGTRAVKTFDDFGHHARTAVYDIATTTLLRELRRGVDLNRFGEVTWVEDGEGNRIDFSYDNTLRLMRVKRTGTNGQVAMLTDYSYDEKTRVTRVTQTSLDGATRRSSQVAYDSRNLGVLAIDPNGEKRRTTFNIFGQVAAVDRFVQPSARVRESYTYDEDGRLRSMTDGGGSTTTFQYNARGDRIATYVSGAGATHLIHTTKYDRRCLPEWVCDARGNVVTNRFDELGRLVERNIQLAPGESGPTFERFRYDDMSQLLEATNDFSTIEQTFNEQGLVVSEAQTHRINGQMVAGTLRTQFTKGGGASRQQYPGGRLLEYTSDQLQRITRITEGTRTLASLSYASPHMPFHRDYANGTSTLFGFDGLARVNAVEHTGPGGTVQASYAYRYDVVGNVLSERETIRQLQDTFTYDSLHRLHSAEVARDLAGGAAGRRIDYEFDWAGNWTSVTDAGRAIAFTSNGLNQYTAVGAPGQVQQVTWDADFNLSESAGRKLFYDYGRCLIRAEKGSRVYTLTYDALRRVIHRRIEEPAQAARETHYFYDQDRVVETTGDEAATYVYGQDLDEVISYRRGGRDFFVHQKRLWSASHVTDDAGRVVESYRYDPYGARQVFDENGQLIADSAIGNVIGFAGRWIEQDLGLYNYRTRWYDYELGRFVSPDPDGWVDGLHVYRYARYNPATFFDPIGTSSTEFLSGLKDGFIKEFVGGWWETLETIGDIILNAGDYIDTLKTMLQALTDPEAAANAWGAIRQAVEEELANAWNIVEDAINALKDGISYGAGQKLGTALGFLASKLLRGGGSIALFFAKIGKKVKDILKWVRCVGTGTGCFAAGTLVMTREGPKPIEEIEVGDEVLARDAVTGEQAYRKVVRVRRGQAVSLCSVSIAAGVDEEATIFCTRAHTFFVANRQAWTDADRLVQGDRLFTPDGRDAEVLAVRWQPQIVTTYNFSVEDWPTYFVMAAEDSTGVWVHNMDLGEDDLEWGELEWDEFNKYYKPPEPDMPGPDTPIRYKLPYHGKPKHSKDRYFANRQLYKKMKEKPEFRAWVERHIDPDAFERVRRNRNPRDPSGRPYEWAHTDNDDYIELRTHENHAKMTQASWDDGDEETRGKGGRAMGRVHVPRTC